MKNAKTKTNDKPSIKDRQMKNKNEMVKPEKAGEIANVVPDFMKAHAGKGVEKLGQGDVAVPRIQLLQSVSPELIANDELRQGEFYHSIAEVGLGKSLRIVPIFTDIRAILWRPRVDGGGILARLDDNVHWSPPNATFEVNLKKKKDDPDVRVKWTTKPTEAEAGLLRWGSANPADPNSQPAATKMHNVVVVLPDYPEYSPAVVTLQRSSIRAAQNLGGKIKIAGAPSFGMYFQMTGVSENGTDGTFFNYKFTADGFVTDEATFNKYKEMYEHFSKMGVQIKDIEGLQEADATSAGKAAEPSDPKAGY